MSTKVSVHDATFHDGSSSIEFKPTINTTASGYEITTAAFNQTTLHITSDGRVWGTRNP